MKLYDLEGKYESEKKEKEIALLKKDQELKKIELQRERTIQYALITFAVLLGLIGFLAINRYGVIQRSRRLAAIERMRNNVARDLHDNIGSTLSSINIISQLALNETKPDNYPQHFRRIGEQSLRMMENMSDMVWSINPNNDSIEKMVIRMKEFSAEILEPNNIGYIFEGEEVFNGAILDVERRKNLFLIFKEAINNAAKYSEATFVSIIISKIDQTLSVLIQDNGKGFDPLKIKNGNGLDNMKERVAQVGGSFLLKAAPGEGTVIKLTMPIT
jgi:two-component system, NarL family, sensor histidine kinase UhpB